MRRYLTLVVSILCINAALLAQQQETFPTRGSGSQRVFKPINNPTEDKLDQFDISGIGSTSFIASNTTDGTTDSYKHAMNVILTLIPTNKSANNNFQLHFYSPADNIQQAAQYKDGLLTIYYPLSLYEPIRAKLDQAIAAKKKITVKVVQRPNGYREGTLLL